MDLGDQLQLDDIQEPQRSTILAALTEIVMSKVAMEAYELLSPEAQTQLEAFDEATTTDDDILTFLQANVPDFDGLVSRIINDERTELADKTMEMRKLLESHAS